MWCKSLIAAAKTSLGRLGDRDSDYDTDSAPTRSSKDTTLDTSPPNSVGTIGSDRAALWSGALHATNPDPPSMSESSSPSASVSAPAPAPIPAPTQTQQQQPEYERVPSRAPSSPRPVAGFNRHGSGFGSPAGSSSSGLLRRVPGRQLMRPNAESEQSQQTSRLGSDPAFNPSVNSLQTIPESQNSGGSLHPPLMERGRQREYSPRQSVDPRTSTRRARAASSSSGPSRGEGSRVRHRDVAGREQRTPLATLAIRTRENTSIDCELTLCEDQGLDVNLRLRR
ncbi:hypothetical protein BJX99DRAFT_225939 [Aspergillus californicus]